MRQGRAYALRDVLNRGLSAIAYQERMLASFAATAADRPQNPMRFEPLDAVRDDRLSAFLGLWTLRRGNRAMPERGDIRPRDMKDYLPDVHLYELVDEGRDFRIRLVGTRFSEAAGYDATGELLSRVAFAPVRERMFSCAKRVVETEAPVYGVAEQGSRPNLRDYRVEAMMVPLATQGALSHILGHVVINLRVLAQA
jgi:hypothetical protein